MVNLIMITVMIIEGGLAVGATLAPVIVMIIADEAGIAIGVLVVVGTRGVILVQDRMSTGAAKTAIIGVAITAACITAAIGMVATQEMEVVTSPGVVITTVLRGRTTRSVSVRRQISFLTAAVMRALVVAIYLWKVYIVET